MKKLFCLALAIIFTLSFTAFAADFTCLSSTVANNASSVYVKEGTITLTFADNIDTSKLSTITMIKSGEEFTDFTATVGAANEVKITFGSDLAYSTQYVIFYGNLESSSGASVSGTSNSLTFTTESEPLVQVESITLTKGVGSAVIEQDDDILEADNTIQGFKVSVKNIVAEAKTVNIVCALYNAKGIIKRVFTSEKSIDATATEMVELGTYIDSSYAGGFAKIYIWNNLSDKSPFVGFRSYNIQ